MKLHIPSHNSRWTSNLNSDSFRFFANIIFNENNFIVDFDTGMHNAQKYSNWYFIVKNAFSWKRVYK